MDNESGKRRHLEGLDVISNLGCNVIKNILKYLPLRDAVRTSILSKAWKNKWFSIPNLIFDRDFVSESCRSCKKLQSIVDHVLLLHKGTIDKFKLDISMFERLPNMTGWIHYLSSCHIQEFTLCLYLSDKYLIPSDSDKYLIPSGLFTFEKLTCLTLSGCKFKPPTGFKGFPLLSLLDLEKVHIVPDELCCFISNCPLLEHLRLENCATFETLNIDVPNLKTFHFCSEFKSIKLKNAALLAEILLYWASPLDEPLPFGATENESNLIGFLGHLSSLTILDLNCSALQFLSIGGVPEKLPENLNHVKVLRVCIDFNVIPQIGCVFCLIRSFPNLESLEISSLEDADDVESVALQFLRAQEMHKISLNQLKEVRISKFLCSEPEVAFVKLLLAAATNLEKLEICSLYSSASETGSQRLKEFARMCRASSESEIIFQESEISF